MNLTLTVEQFNNKHLYFYDAIDNTIIENSKFIKMIYSEEDYILNGIYILLELNISNRELYFKKYKFNFDIRANSKLINNVYKIEEDILNKYDCGKNKKNNIKELFNNGYFKIHSSDETNFGNKFILKMSGIWETVDEYGITYKIIQI